MDLTFAPIRPENFALAYEFLRDSFRISFGADESRWPNGLNRLSLAAYVAGLRQRLTARPDGALHVHEGDVIIGQIEWSVKPEDPTCGYVSLYYVIPEKRGRGYAPWLDTYVTRQLAGLGCTRMQLSVEHTNARAIAFYKKVGWRDAGRNPKYDALLMEKRI